MIETFLPFHDDVLEDDDNRSGKAAVSHSSKYMNDHQFQVYIAYL